MAIIVPLAIFAGLFLPFLGIFPYMDGNTEFKVAYNFYSGRYLTNWIPYHPPLKPILSSVLFSVFGFSAYTALGLILGLVGVVSLYVIAQKLFDKKTALLSSVFLAVSGLYISNALFSLNDFLMTVFILAAFAFYVREKYFWYALTASLAVCSKESAIIFPFCIMFVDSLQKKFRFEYIIPFIVLTDWILFLNIMGHSLWNSWNFSDTHSKGILYTMINNIVTLKIFNNYAYENWLHLFVFNYNWVFWLCALIALFKIRINKYILTIYLFTFLYATTVLTIQTYAIPRYVLPLLPFVYIMAAYFLLRVKYASVFIGIVILISLAGLFSSNDPISNSIWKNYAILNNKFYLNQPDGVDGITYNMQFLLLAKDRDRLIKAGKYKNSMHTLNIDADTLALYHLNK